MSLVAQTCNSRSKLKILCMHGFATNKDFMKMQMESLRRDLDLIADLIFVDSPFVIPSNFVIKDEVQKNIDGVPRSWSTYKIVSKLVLMQIRCEILRTL